MTDHRIFPAFPGHFDGDPLVPGAALLAWVQERVPALTGIARARFTSPLRPGEAATLAWRIEGDRVEFEVHGPHGPCARGVGLIGVRP